MRPLLPVLMKPASPSRRLFTERPLAAALALAFTAASMPALAQLPGGASVVHGTAAITTNGSQMTVTNSPNAILNWQSFSIGAGNSVRFEQPSASSQVLNRVVGNEASSILGSLSSNGRVWLVNPHGVLFGPDARIDVGGLVTSTLGISNADFLAGRHSFENATGTAGAQILNQGQIQTPFGGRVWLIGDTVQNEGLIQSPGGSLVLAAGKSVELVDSGMPNVVVRITAPDNQVVNLGTLLTSTAGGSIDLHGGIVNQQGIVRADSVSTDAAGRIFIKAQGDLRLGGVTSASQGAAGPGGTITAESATGTTLVYGTVEATSAWGTGGQVQLLGKQIGLIDRATVDVSGATGGGHILVGGDYQGQNPAVPNASATYIGTNTSLKANATALGDGGRVIAWGDQATRVYGHIEARGGPDGGNGGFIETSGGYLDARPQKIDVSAPRGQAGTWLLDPNDITIESTTTGQTNVSETATPGALFLASTDDNSIVSAEEISIQIDQGTHVVVRTGSGGTNTQAGDITVRSDIIPPGEFFGPLGSLTLEAHRDIVVTDARIQSQAPDTFPAGRGPMPITLTADLDGNGTGGIRLSNATLGTDGGNVLLNGGGPSGRAQGVEIVNSTIDTRASGLASDGNITIHSTGQTTGVGAGAAIDVKNWSRLDAGTGTLTLDGASSVGDGIVLSTSDLTADTIMLDGKSASGTAVKLLMGDPADEFGPWLSGNTITVKGDVMAPGQTGGQVSITDSTINSFVNPDSPGSVTISSPSQVLVGDRSGIYAEGPITLRSEGRMELFGEISSQSSRIQASAGTDLLIGTGAWIGSYAEGEAIELHARTISSDGGPVSLSAPWGHWRAYSDTSDIHNTDNAIEVLQPDFLQFNTSYNTANKDDHWGLNGLLYAAPLSVSMQAGTRTYDGTTAMTLNGASTSAVIPPNFSVQEQVTAASVVGTFADKNVGTGKTISYSGDHFSVSYASETLPTRPVYGASLAITGDITPLWVAPGPIAAQGKAYDGTTVAQALAGNAPSGALDGDDVRVDASTAVAAFSDKNVGSAKPVMVSGLSLAGADAGNYQLVNTGAETTADIWARLITANGLTAQNKVYDGTTAATLGGAPSALTATDDVALGGAVGTFNSRQAGTGKQVTIDVTGASLSGADAGNYTLDTSTNPSVLADITPRPLTAGGFTVQPKVYDGTVAATLTGGALTGMGTAAGVIAGDNVALGGASGSFDTRHVGQGKLVTVNALSLTGTDAANYALDSTVPVTALGTITPKVITTSGLTAQNKVYDGNTTATLGGALAGLVAGDAVSFSGATGTFDNRNAGSNKLVSITGGALSGTDAGNYALDAAAVATARADITPRPLSVTAYTAQDKVYDGTRNATLSGGTLSGVLAGDAVALGAATGLFDSKDVGNGKRVTVNGGALSGADAGNYQIAGNVATTAFASITPKELAVGAITVHDKVYDGTRDATVNGGAISGVVAGDAVTLSGASGLFDSKDVGSDKRVTVNGGTLSGADAGNYRLGASGPSTAYADITPRPLAVADFTAQDKVYDGTRNATLEGGSLAGMIAGDTVVLTGVAGLFDTKDVGTAKHVTISGGTLAGTDAGNYRLGTDLPASARADITPRPITVAGFTAQDKVYDGTRDATVSGSLSGVIAGDAVAIGGATGTFDTRHVGTDKWVSIAGATLAGTDAGNYRLEGEMPSTARADITARPITASGTTAQDKVYDGNRNATLAGSLADVLAGDAVTLSGATGTFDTKNAGTDKLVAIQGGTLTGPDAGNYRLDTTAPVSARANITPKPIDTLHIVGPVTKEYDTGTQAALTDANYTAAGLVANDVVGVRGPAVGQYDTANAGTQKRVTATGAFGLAGDDARNYTLSTGSASGQVGQITPALLTYNADPVVREAGSSLDGLTGTLTGFKGQDTLDSQTTGALQWTTPAPAGAPAGSYAVLGSGLASTNYTFRQAAANSSALTLVPGVAPNLNVALAEVRQITAPVPQPASQGSVLDVTRLSGAGAFGAIDIAAMKPDFLTELLVSRKEFKKKLFADAIYRLEIDPDLADLQPCRDAADAASGLCLITAEQSAALAGTQARPPQNARPATSPRKAALPQIERKIAVFFGINDYMEKKIPSLHSAIPDVDALSALFAQRLGYETRVVHNPTKADIVRTLNRLSAEAGSADSVVVYFAGHGYSLENQRAGYWLPADATADNPRGWLSNNDISRLLASFRSKQMALISDSCYSGAFALEGGALGRDIQADEVLNKRSVVVLSSGGDEPVADEGKEGHSIFAWNLMKSIGAVRQWNPGTSIFDEVLIGVTREFPQTPTYAAVRSAGHQAGGEYLFEVR